MSGGRWCAQPERGSRWIVRLGVWLTLHLGWQIGRLLLLPITAYFYLASGPARAASRDYLGRVLGRPAGARDVLRHFHSFASAILDRLFLVLNRTEAFKIEIIGLDAVDSLLAAGRGGVLLGAHLGSFEVLRAIARHCPVHVSALMYRGNAGVLTRLLEQLNPELQRQVIDIGAVDAMLAVRERVEGGELVGILADRAVGAQKSLATPFLGGMAAFPAGPVMLAATLGAPVVLFCGVRTGPRRYQVHFVPFADRITLRRGQRIEDARLWVTRYAAQVEAWCRLYPTNWFNFFPFWETSPDAAPAPRDNAVLRLGVAPSRIGANRGRARRAVADT